MVITSHLFTRGRPFKPEASLSDVLEGYKQGILKKVRGISDLDQMTDAFLERLVKDSLVEPLHIQFDKMTRRLRTEQFDGSQLPFDQFGDPGRSYPKQVARLTIPFSGDPTLLGYAPNPCDNSFPRGEVSGNTIQFDVILWRSPDDVQRVASEIQEHRELTTTCASAINNQVREFNKSLPAQVKAAFAAKLDELTKQHAFFDALGIAQEEPVSPTTPSSPSDPQPRKGRARAVQIIQNVETMYVQQLNQSNYNVGDVNNAIQSGE